MRLCLFLCRTIAAVAIFASPFPSNAAKSELTFVPLPLESAEKTIATWRPIIDYLNAELPFKISILYIDKYKEIQKAHSEGKIDLALYGPLPYVEVRTRAPHLEPFLVFHDASGSSTYRCALLAQSKETWEYLRKGKMPLRVALTQPQSTCGFLSTDYLLQQEGQTLRHAKYRYLGRHDAVGEAVVGGEFPLGGLTEAFGKRYETLGAIVVKTTDPIPGFALVANTKTVVREQIESIQTTIMNAPSPIRERWGNYRFGASLITDDHYENFRKLVRLVLSSGEIPQENND
ncbi:MAG: PhnD/SsuA/transferrin family substrate-binding protein [Hydrogenophilus sp.]|nr:PhnD/SsuA/transferrin family substrate-binding protein [Hydrogenophilus sp.]